MATNTYKQNATAKSIKMLLELLGGRSTGWQVGNILYELGVRVE